jgi:1,4-dihydroxy-2-naphthoate octaprenyltransferase
MLGEFTLYLFIFTLLPALAIQIATNLFNDAIDYRKGADTQRRIGPQRMASSGRIPPESLFIAGIAFVLIALTLSLVLVLERGWSIVAIGAPSLFFFLCIHWWTFSVGLPWAWRNLRFSFFWTDCRVRDGVCTERSVGD